MNSPIFKLVFSIVICLLAAAQSGCGGDGGGDPAPVPSNTPPPEATEVGSATGAATSVTMGAEGGTLVSPDGRMKVTVPAAALASNTTISMQPVTNHAHGSTGGAYRLTPDGQVFAKPVKITFAYTDADLVGSADAALGVAFQRPDRLWEWMDPVLDTAAKTVSVETTHFSDWSLVRGFRLLPHTSTVGTGKSIAMRVVYCYPPAPLDGDDLLQPLGYACSEHDPLNGLSLLFAGSVDGWSVDGAIGGSSAKGTITPDNSGSSENFNATFKAPPAVPTPDTVSVSARVRNRSAGKTLVMATVKITDAPDYSGTVEFTNGVAAGTATVNWTKLQEVDGIATYMARGTVDVVTQIEGCASTRVTLPLVSDTDASTGTYKMVVNPLGGRYYFHLVGDGPDVTLNCGGYPTTVPAYFLTTISIGTITTECTEPPTYTDRMQLAGTWSCPTTGHGGTWAFKAPQ